MATTISSTGKLREFLANMMLGVKDGTIDVNKGRTILKMAEKINESFYAELKVAQVALQLKNKVDELGHLQIGER